MVRVDADQNLTRSNTPMKNDTTILPFRQSGSIADPLTELAREGARRMLAEALKKPRRQMMRITQIQA